MIAIGVRPAFEQAQIRLAGARAAYVGPPLDLAPHRVAVATLVVGLTAAFNIDFGDGGQQRTAILIPSATRHHLRANGATLFVYLDPLGDDPGEVQCPADVTAIAELLAADSWRLDELCVHLGLRTRRATDPRVAALLTKLDTAPQDFPTLAAAARVIGLSDMRCRLLIRQSTGVRFSRYRLWRRLALAVRLATAGSSLTEAAHAAGFASSAHLSSSFRAMFGLTPSALLARRPRLVDETAMMASPCAAPLRSAPYSL